MSITITLTAENQALLDRYVELSAATDRPITHEAAVNLALSVLLPDWVAAEEEDDVRRRGMTTRQVFRDITRSVTRRGRNDG